MGRREVKVVGEYGNLWNEEVVSYNDESAIVHLESYAHISITVACFSDAGLTTPEPATIEFLASPDGQHFTFCNQITADLPGTANDISESHAFETIGTEYMKLRRNDSDTASDVYIRATVQAKA